MGSRFLGGIAAAAALLLSIPASAAPPAPSWTGCYIGANIGTSVTANNTTLATTVPGLSLGFDGLSSENILGGGQIGCDMQVGPNFVFGIFGGYSFRNEADTKIPLTVPGGAAQASMGLGDSWELGARAGLLASPSTLIYGLAAYEQAEARGLDISVNGANVLAAPLADWKGWSLGAGIETVISGPLSLKLEGKATWWDNQTVALVPGALDMNVEPITYTGRVGVSYKFNFDGAGSLK